MGIPLCVICCFSLAVFNICSSFLIFINLINMCLGVFHLGFILERGFTNVVSATTIIIPDSITEIQSEAFSGCKNLTGLFIPASVTTIGDLAFAKVPNVHFEIKESEVPDTWTALLGNTNSYWGATREE